ncbi:MAG TPA: hypothetical protein VKM54_04260 [Myxococcota bacterium]|nr:hypothetical protein [Myxococcota bacterium]
MAYLAFGGLGHGVEADQERSSRASTGSGRHRIVKDPVRRLTVDYERADFDALEGVSRRRGGPIVSAARETEVAAMSAKLIWMREVA